jgi:hypothetical protein
MSTTPDVTGWWAEVHKQFIVALPLALADTALTRFTAGFPITFTPAITVGAQGYSGHSAATVPIALTLAVTPTATAVPQATLPIALTLSVTPTGTLAPQANFALGLAPALGILASPNAGHSTGSFAVDTTPTVGITQGTAQAGAATVDTTPTLTFTGAEHYTAATTVDISGALGVGMAGTLHPAPSRPEYLNQTITRAATH